MQPIVKRKLWPHVPFVKRVIIGLVLFLLVSFGVYGYFKMEKYGFTFTRIQTILEGQGNGLKKDSLGRTNILLLGMGGEGHDGGDLTDTMMVVSIERTKNDLVLISLPRDIWIDSLKDKINSVYKIGETKKIGGGMILTKATVEEVVGLPIHYATRINFSGFKKLVDTIGGINVKIEKSFTDKEYPISGKENDMCSGDPKYRCRYETIEFKEGVEHMDGERALKYVRSRHGEGEEGNDFSRGRRQQAVLVAFKNKLVQRDIVTNFSLLKKLQNEIGLAVITDMSLGEVVELTWMFANGQDQVMVRSIGLTQDEPEKGRMGLLINPPVWQYDGMWVLIPKHKDYSHIHQYIECVVIQAAECEKFFE